jgi:hypothetical protein
MKPNAFSSVLKEDILDVFLISELESIRYLQEDHHQDLQEDLLRLIFI